MSTTVITTTGRNRWRLAGRTRKAVLLAHTLGAGVWIGLDVAMGVLVFTAVGTGDRETRAAILQVLRLVTVWPMFTAAVFSLVTGVILGLGSKYGLVRYWWVLIKLVLNIVLGTLVVTALRGGVAEAAVTGRTLATTATATWDAHNMIMPPIVSTTALVIAYALSVFKPGGPVRRRR